MVTKEIQRIRVGVFIAIALGVAMLMIFMIGSKKNIFQTHYKLKCTFKDISGLRIGAPIQLAGVSVGFVDNIRFPKDLMKKDIEVSLKISDRYKERIREDSIATINTQGLLGDKYIFVSVGSADKPVLKDDEYLKTKEVVGLFALAEKGGEILEDLKIAAEAAGKFFEDLHEGRDDIKDAMSSIKNILNQAEKGKGLIHALVYDPKGQQILNDISSSMHSLKALLGQTERDEQGRVNNIVANLNRASKNISDITEKIEKGQGTIGGLINDPTIYNEIRSLFGKANRNSLFKTVVRTTLAENDKEVLK